MTKKGGPDIGHPFLHARDTAPAFLYKIHMPKPVAAKSRKRSEEAVLDQATQQLLRAAKDAAAKNGRRVDPAQLRKEGYSDRFIEKVESA